jgi:reactive chlorine resistance protein C
MEMEERTLQITTILTQAPVYLQATGLFLLRYGLAAMMLFFGLQKWTKAEAEGVQPWVSHSPLMSWLHHVTSVQGASVAIGVVELAIAVMIISRR